MQANRVLMAIVIVTSTIVGCAEQPAPFDEGANRVPVVNDAGQQVGTIPADAVEDVAATGDRVEVIDESGEQVGWWTDDGFEPLDGG